MNICFFNWQESSDSAVTGGIERATSLFAKELRRRGHNVEFFFTPSRRFRLPLGSVLLSSLFNRSAGVRFREFLKEHKIDVAVWHEGGDWATPFPLKNLPCKLVTFLHAPPHYREQAYADAIVKKIGLRLRLAQWIAWKFFETCRSRFFFYALRQSDKFVLLSESFFVDFAPWKKFPEKVCAIPNIATFDAQSVSFEEKKKELLWVARMVFDQKRPDFMLQIWRRIQDRFPDWRLRIVGDGPYLPELKALAKELGVQRVSFEGFQDPAPYYRSASIFCMTSAYEGFPMTLLEAQSCGCIPVAFDSFSAIHDIIDDGINGVLVSSFNIDAYAEKLAHLMHNPELRSRLAPATQESVTKFSSETVGDKLEKLLVEGGGRKKKELLWVGRVEFNQKRPDYLLQIWRRIQDRFPDWSLRFVGDGGYLPELKKLSTSLGIKNVSFEGFRDPTPYYRSASIFCMTSAYEGFGLVLVEAQAYGCVPVAFDSFSAIHDIIDDGINGILVLPFDLDVYVEKLSELMQNPTLRSQLGSAAKKSVARFSPETIGDKWEKLLQNLG